MTAPSWVIHHGDCLDVMRAMEPASVDSICCDPPYALTANKKGGTGAASINLESPYGRARIGTGNGGGGFMGKAWDSSLPSVEVWVEALRVAKPGAHLLAFGGTRTFHRLTCAIEDAGWEIRDCLSWLYGSGFPKSHNGPWGGTALKPAWEPVILARKPLIGTVAANHAAHGTGALNIDGCRIDTNGEVNPASVRRGYGATIRPTSESNEAGRWRTVQDEERYQAERPGEATGRWPANVLLDEGAAEALDEATEGDIHSAGSAQGPQEKWAGWQSDGRCLGGGIGSNACGARVGDFGGASRFFYTAKASRGEREAGLREAAVGSLNMRTDSHAKANGNDTAPARNTHPTVKPVDLMRWLVRLVTPIGGTVLDPFLGSGTTGVAALEEGCRFIGIEREAEYVAIARARIAAAANAPTFDFTGGV